MKITQIIVPGLVLATGIAFAQDTGGDADAEGWADSFPLDRYSLVATGKNPYWQLTPGRYVVLGGLQPAGGEFVLISVLDETEMVDGVETRVIEEREYENGQLKEISRNFFAMAKETDDVFYFGEDVDDYENGAVSGHGGQWRAGTAGATAGLFMPGKPVEGMRYYMEIHPGVAMDRAEIYQTDAMVETPAGNFRRSLIVTESSPLEEGDESYKRYARNVGMIFDDGLELYTYGRKFPSEWLIEFEISEDEMPSTPARIVRELHPTGVIREVKVELHPDHVRYAIETIIDGAQWDVEVANSGEVFRNTLD